MRTLIVITLVICICSLVYSENSGGGVNVPVDIKKGDKENTTQTIASKDGDDSQAINTGDTYYTNPRQQTTTSTSEMTYKQLDNGDVLIMYPDGHAELVTGGTSFSTTTTASSTQSYGSPPPQRSNSGGSGSGTNFNIDNKCECRDNNKAGADASLFVEDHSGASEKATKVHKGDLEVKVRPKSKCSFF